MSRDSLIRATYHLCPQLSALLRNKSWSVETWLLLHIHAILSFLSLTLLVSLYEHENQVKWQHLALGLKPCSDCIYFCSSSSWAYSLFHIYPHISGPAFSSLNKCLKFPLLYTATACLPVNSIISAWQGTGTQTADPETLHLFSDLDMNSSKANTLISAFWPLSSMHPILLPFLTTKSLTQTYRPF